MQKDLTLKQLTALRTLAEVGTFRGAADRLGIAQPSLSAQIAGLEEALGQILVERGRNGALLTPVGRVVDAHAREVLDTVRQLNDSVAAGPGGTIRLGVTPTLGPYLLPQVVGRLTELEPNLKLYIREAPPRDLSTELVQGVHDAVVTHLPVQAAELDSVELFRERLLLIVPRNHPLASKEELTRNDLRGLEVLSLDQRYQLHDQVVDLCATFGAVFKREYEGTSLDALRVMAGLGMGVTFLPRLYVASEIKPDSEVVARELSGRSIFRSIGIVWRRTAGRSQTLDLLAEVLRDSFSDLNG